MRGNKILPGTGRGTMQRSGMVEGAHRHDSATLVGRLHRPSDGPPPRAGEEL